MNINYYLKKQFEIQFNSSWKYEKKKLKASIHNENLFLPMGKSSI